MALTLGARDVLVGRAHVYGLAAADDADVRHCIDTLARELRMTMHPCGARRIAELNRGMIRSRRPWPSAGADPITPRVLRTSLVRATHDSIRG